ncbi:MAG: D-glycero-alpha-D-manno-heptose-1,7-bisphosphate 7-phosphatase [Longimicrobiales bacterium]
MPTPDPALAARPSDTEDRARGSRPAAFLDRDGTIVIERYYLADPERVQLVPGAAGALKRLAAAGFALVVVTNQSAIAQGIYTVNDFEAVQRRIEEKLAAEGVRLDGVYYCPHHPAFTGPCRCRKPEPGLFQEAAGDLGLDFTRSAFIGDRVKDVIPALPLGGRGFLVRTGYGMEHQHHAPQGIEVVDDLAAAADRILDETGKRSGRLAPRA